MYSKLLVSTSRSVITRCAASTKTLSTKYQTVSARAQSFIDLEARFGTAHYHPIPVVIQRGSGSFVCLSLCI